MSLYIVVVSALLIGTVFESLGKINKTIHYAIYISLLIVLTCMLCFRLDQGTDYWSYKLTYNGIPRLGDLNKVNLRSVGINGDNGWTIINSLFVTVGANFKQFVIVISLVQMIFLGNSIKAYCKEYWMFALLLSYHTLYLTYLFSGMREGLVICLFLGGFLKFFLKKKYFKYCICVLVCSTIHVGAIVYFIPLVVEVLKVKCKPKINLKYICMFTWLLGVLVSIPDIQSILKPYLPHRVTFYLDNGATAISWASVAFQIVMAVMISYLMKVLNDRSIVKNKDEGEMIYEFSKLYDMYLIGFAIYGLFMPIPFVAARSSFYLTAVQIPILCGLVDTIRIDSRRILISALACICLVMTIKNIQSYINQNIKEYSLCTVWSYPYKSIFTESDGFDD